MMRRTSIIVVIVIVAVSGGLLIHAIRKASDASMRTQCVNNLKQIVLGLHDYQQLYKKFPSATLAEVWHRDLGAVLVSHEERISWMFEVTVFESRMGLKRRRPDLTKPWNAEESRYIVEEALYQFVCPATVQPRLDYLLTHYVGIAGLGKDAIRLAKDDKSAGLFGYNRGVTVNDIKDGLSTSMAVSETAQDNDRWAKPGHATVRGLESLAGPYLGTNGQFNSHHYYREGWTNKRCIIHIGVADGSARLLAETVSPRVFEALATIAGGENIEPGDW